MHRLVHSAFKIRTRAVSLHNYLHAKKKKRKRKIVHFFNEVGVAFTNSSLQRVRAALLRAKPRGGINCKLDCTLFQLDSA